MTDDVTEIQRRIAAARERRGQTYMGQVTDLEMGGRFAELPKATVTGTEPVPMVPQQPAGSPWKADPVGPEPPLGYNVDDQEPVGEVHERKVDDPGDAAAGIRLRRRI
jgi:hypothetical protein